MALTPAQYTVLKTHIESNPDLVDELAVGADEAIAQYLNELDPQSTACWKTSMTRDEVWNVMNWTVFIGRSQPERDAFGMLFMGSGIINPSNLNVRQAFADIFSGSAVVGSPALRTALNNAAKRTMTRGEKLFATDVDLDAVFNLTFEGELMASDIARALRG